MAELSPEAQRMIRDLKYRKVDPAQKCTQIIEAALKEYGCFFEVVMIPQVTVKLKPKA
jgi:hypothetical protein